LPQGEVLKQGNNIWFFFAVQEAAFQVGLTDSSILKGHGFIRADCGANYCRL